jgi:soluble lytic murein transglycosylase-like protein
MSVKVLFAVACTILLWPSQADAQIYAWRDANGNLVLSDRKLEADARTYAVEGSAAVRTTRPVAPRQATAFEPLIQEHARAQGLRPDLVRAVIQVESASYASCLKRLSRRASINMIPLPSRSCTSI